MAEHDEIRLLRKDEEARDAQFLAWWREVKRGIGDMDDMNEALEAWRTAWVAALAWERREYGPG